MNIIDKLLTTDITVLQEGLKRDFEITRLSKKLGIPFILQCKPLSSEQMEHIVEISKNNITDIKLNAILEGCSLENKSINNAALLEKFGCLTGKELIEKLFIIGEISELYQIINEISGYSKDAVKEVKKH